MDNDAKISATVGRIQAEFLSLSELLANNKSAEAKLKEAERLRKAAEKSLISERARCEDAERRAKGAEEKNRRLEAEVFRLTGERDELQRKVDIVAAVAGPRSESGSSPAVKKPRTDGAPGDARAPATVWRTSAEGELLDNRGGDPTTRRPPVDIDEVEHGIRIPLLCQTFHPVNIREIDGTPGRRVFTVHYKGWNAGYDEKVSEDDARIRFRRHREPPQPGLTGYFNGGNDSD